MSQRSFDVLLQDAVVGVLVEADDGMTTFKLDERYRAMSDRPVLSQSFEDALDRLYRCKGPGRLPAFFSNLLPEGRFRQVVEKSLPAESRTDVGLLLATGNDLAGAVGVRPSAAEVSAGELVDATQPATNGDTVDLGLRFSLAGVQLKFSMLGDGQHLTMPAHGARGNWIVKVATADFSGLVENEFAMMEWARHGGFEVPECALLTLDDLESIRSFAPPSSRVFAIRRYDREGSRRIHQEDFLQVMGIANEGLAKYEARYEFVARIALRLIGEQGYEEVLRRLVLMCAMGNSDAHLKNWAVLYLDGKTPSLSPLYDLVATVAWPSHDGRLALKFGGGRAFGTIDRGAWQRFADAVGANPHRSIEVAMATAGQLKNVWPAIREANVLPPEHKARLGEHWKSVPFLRELGPLEI